MPKLIIANAPACGSLSISFFLSGLRRLESASIVSQKPSICTPPDISTGMAATPAANNSLAISSQAQSLAQPNNARPMAMPTTGKAASMQRMFSLFHSTLGMGILENMDSAIATERNMFI